MGTVYNRGTKHNPRWWIGYKDRAGEWAYANSGQPTKEQARKYLLQVESNVADGKAGLVQPGDVKLCDTLLDDWKKTLTNRNAADDGYRIANHLRPMFEAMPVLDVSLAVIMTWLDAQRDGTAPRKERPKKPQPPTLEVGNKKRPGPKPKPKAPKPERTEPAKLSDASIRHNLNLLSRFLGWCVERGEIPHNPVRDIPQGRRPTQAAKREQPWLDDDAMVGQLMAALVDPIGLMFYLANRAGLRTGEVAGLRMSDMAFLKEGAIRARYSYDGPLKEDKGKGGAVKTKWVPAPADVDRVLASHLKKRKADKAKGEDFLFPCPTRDGSYYRKEFIERCWEIASKACGVDLTWYQATRHSFVSRTLTAGATLDEVSAAVGHSSPVVTRRYYDHLIRKTFSDTLRAGLPASDAQT